MIISKLWSWQCNKRNNNKAISTWCSSLQLWVTSHLSNTKLNIILVILLPLGGLCKLCCFRKLNTVTTPPKTLQKSGEYTLSKKIRLLVGFFFFPPCMLSFRRHIVIWHTWNVLAETTRFHLKEKNYYRPWLYCRVFFPRRLTWLRLILYWKLHSNMTIKILSAENMFFKAHWHVMAENQMVILHLRFWESRQ